MNSSTPSSPVLDSPAPSEQSDIVRQLLVVISLTIAIVGAVVGSGVLGGTPIGDAAGGAFGPDATLIAPAGGAFAIWTAIYLGLAAYTVWQALPSVRENARQRILGPPIAVSLVLNAIWILAVQFGLVWASVVIIVALLAVLALTFRRVILTRTFSSGWVESVVVDGTVGLYLGWVCVATAANVAVSLTAAGFTGWGLAPEAIAVVVLAVAGAVGVALAVAGRGRLAPAAALGWGLVWVAVSRTTGELQSSTVATTAIIAAVVVVLATVVFRLLPGSTPRLAGPLRR